MIKVAFVHAVHNGKGIRLSTRAREHPPFVSRVDPHGRVVIKSNTSPGDKFRGRQLDLCVYQVLYTCMVCVGVECSKVCVSDGGAV